MQLKLGRLQTLCLIAIGNGYRGVDRDDKRAMALHDKHLITWLDARDGGWVLTQIGRAWLVNSKTVLAITSTAYYPVPDKN